MLSMIYDTDMSQKNFFSHKPEQLDITSKPFPLCVAVYFCPLFPIRIIMSCDSLRFKESSVGMV